MAISDWLWRSSPWRVDTSQPSIQSLPQTDIPYMITPAEREYFYWRAMNLDKSGAVVEIGPWLGCSTFYIASGLRDAENNAPFHVFDKFEWVASAGWDAKLSGSAHPGDDFLEAFKQNLAPFIDRLTIHQTRIDKLTWSDGPVEIMFIDAAKRPRDISKVLTVFGPHLSHGSLMVWQDFKHIASFHIPACLSRLWRFIEPIHSVQEGTTVTFRVRKPWSKRHVTPHALMGNWTPDAVMREWQRMSEFSSPQQQCVFASGAIFMLYEIGARDLARARLKELFDSGDEISLAYWKYFGALPFRNRFPDLFDMIPEPKMGRTA